MGAHHIILSEDSFLHIGNYKIHNMIEASILYPHAYNHLHAPYACVELGSAHISLYDTYSNMHIDDTINIRSDQGLNNCDGP
jgi:hypothetical protein